MWDAASALTWIVETLLRKREDDAQRKWEKWRQVADYLENVAGLVDNTANNFQNGHIPHDHYSQLDQLGCDFGCVLAQVYDEKKEDEYWKSYEYSDAFFHAMHLIETGNVKVMESAGSPLSPEGQKVLIDLQSAAGQFHGLAMTLRAAA